MADFIFAAAKKAVMVIQEYKKLKGQMSKCVIDQTLDAHV